MFTPPETAPSSPRSRPRILSGPVSVSAALADACVRCGACTAHCGFLARNRTPGELAADYIAAPDDSCRTLGRLAFECSLCGLCTALCPLSLDPSAMFLQWRQAMVDSGKASLAPYRRILWYEKKGVSPLFSFYSLPKGCTTVFFPGCTLAGVRPDILLNTHAYLCKTLPGTGIVLDCCAKPSHDLGRRRAFNSLFSEMTAFLKEQGVTTVVTACPSCHRIFSDHSPFKAVTVYQIMARDPALSAGAPGTRHNTGPVVIQDPCQARFDRPTRDAVRTIAANLGVGVKMSRFTGEKTLCCGEGGFTGCLRPDRKASWARKRKRDTQGMPAITYCAGCLNVFRKESGSRHVLDLVFTSEKAFRGGAGMARPPFTYLNRLRLKQRLKKIPADVIRERPLARPPRKPHSGRLRHLINALFGT